MQKLQYSHKVWKTPLAEKYWGCVVQAGLPGNSSSFRNRGGRLSSTPCHLPPCGEHLLCLHPLKEGLTWVSFKRQEELNMRFSVL